MFLTNLMPYLSNTVVKFSCIVNISIYFAYDAVSLADKRHAMQLLSPLKAKLNHMCNFNLK